MTCKLCGDTKLYARGQCRSCYRYCERQVRLGHTTWDRIVLSGMAEWPYGDEVVEKLRTVAANARSRKVART